MKKLKTRPSLECLCRCGGITKGGRFLPGHDAKLKKALIESARSGSKRALNKLTALGWIKFYDPTANKSAPPVNRNSSMQKALPSDTQEITPPPSDVSSNQDAAMPENQPTPRVQTPALQEEGDSRASAS